ncbi:NAD(P)H-hydrate dehydratase [Mariprofundus erugo]|uniref:NAD(P)H-hydrate dehydratase n=1 Tax=Mariprofundus erugo TaxID=2528639 RepID=UPI0010FD55B2|nr:NAD(P)H-hydrate dehydratase [Mariprofundus erugo]TLS76374.1 NAD(P)H-hydrate dehydratase [Mariprofundus erugo]
MSVRILSAAQMRWADAAAMAAGMTGFDLMDRAGKAVTDAVLEHMPDFGRVVIVTGSGNNGGDGFAAARYLRQRGVPVTLVMLTPLDQLPENVRLHAQLARDVGAKLREAVCDVSFTELNRWLARAVIVVDAILGSGVNRVLAGRVAEAVAQINLSGRPVLSIDIASGLNADTGQVMGDAIHAGYTLPVAACKWGYWMGHGPEYSGTLLPVACIGIEDALLCRAWSAVADPSACEHTVPLNSANFIDVEAMERGWPRRSRLSHKGSFGHVWVFGGSPGFTGAPKLAALGALASGAGLVSMVCPDEVWPVVAAGSLEAMVHSHSSRCWQSDDAEEVVAQADAVVAGPGWGIGQQSLLTRLLATSRPLLLDADALNMIAADARLQASVRERSGVTVLTPHPGEAARMLGCSVDEVQADRKRSVLKLARCYASWVVLKGHETLISSPAGDLTLNPFGSPQLAVAGSGDVLAGMLGRQLAFWRRQGGDIGSMIAAAVALHGSAGERSGWYLASELAGVVASMRQSIEKRH